MQSDHKECIVYTQTKEASGRAHPQPLHISCIIRKQERIVHQKSNTSSSLKIQKSQYHFFPMFLQYSFFSRIILKYVIIYILLFIDIPCLQNRVQLLETESKTLSQNTLLPLWFGGNYSEIVKVRFCACGSLSKTLHPIVQEISLKKRKCNPMTLI